MKNFLAAPLLVLALAFLAPVWLGSAPALAAEGDIVLPAPAKSGGAPILDALSKRKSHRSFKSDSLAPEQLSAILWAAFGVSRDDDHRTIPTWRGGKDLAVYAVLSSGVYLYNPVANTLEKVLSGDRTGEYGGAPLTLLYAGPTDNGQVGGFHSGSAYQSAALYCASEGLANVVKVTGADALKDELKPPNGWSVLVVQSIGFPAGANF
ncbi:MAG: nitroreductase family protein [Deltaproteobacteria bacterium]|nr:nitroreductase family protein [Deltaproteobacteria bacterium]